MTVAYQTASGFGVRTKRQLWDAARTERKRVERVEARTDGIQEHKEHNQFRRLMAPKHARRLEPHSREWMEACDRAFCEAMEAAGYQKRAGKETERNAIGSTR